VPRALKGHIREGQAGMHHRESRYEGLKDWEKNGEIFSSASYTAYFRDHRDPPSIF
jgi:hypothetical protein